MEELIREGYNPGAVNAIVDTIYKNQPIPLAFTSIYTRHTGVAKEVEGRFIPAFSDARK